MGMIVVQRPGHELTGPLIANVVPEGRDQVDATGVDQKVGRPVLAAQEKLDLVESVEHEVLRPVGRDAAEHPLVFSERGGAKTGPCRCCRIEPDGLEHAAAKRLSQGANRQGVSLGIEVNAKVLAEYMHLVPVSVELLGLKEHGSRVPRRTTVDRQPNREGRVVFRSHRNVLGGIKLMEPGPLKRFQ